MFAYDDSSSLFLNSANILIPNIPGMSTKTVLDFLNSSLYQFLYEKLFGELKVLKGNLSELPFPKIDSKTNNELSLMVDEIIYEGKNNQKEIDEIVYSIIKDGGSYPILDLPCKECGEYWICIDESFTNRGKCLNCGKINEVTGCERCGCYDFGTPSDDDYPFLCDGCCNYYKEE